MTNEYSQNVISTDKFVLPRSSYHKLYVKRSKAKHVLFALFVVAILVFASIFLSSLR